MNRLSFLILSAAATIALCACPNPGASAEAPANADSIPSDTVPPDTAATSDDTAKYFRLTDEDYRRVADELGIDVATMKAVVEIEAGQSHRGFVEPGLPLVNFDLTMFKRFMRAAKKSYAGHTCSTAFQRVNARKYGSYGKAQWARLESAREIDRDIADKATFWGMFQIGGFNWKSCGCASLEEFVERMAASEAEQLELFAQFCINRGLVKYLKKKDWNSFAYHYNGPSYKKRGYHTRLRRAHAKHKK